MNRAELNAYIVANIYPNGNNEVTAPMVRDSALAIVAFIGDAGTYGVGGVVPGGQGLVTGGAVYSAINTALSAAVKFQGVTTTPLTDGSTNPDIVIDGDPYTAHRGDEVIYGGLEFLWTGSKWQQLGDEQSYALKTISISAGAGLTGGGDLTQNRTISLSQDSLNKLALAASAYQVPQGGIPKADLASAVQTSLGNADAIAGYFSGGKLKYAHLPDLYLARTLVSGTAANKTLYGVDGISHAAAADNTDKSRVVWDADNDAWHFYGNIYTDGWWSGRGVSPGGGGGGGGIDPSAMWSLLGAPTSEPINSTHISFPVTSVVGLQGAVSAAQIAAALGLGSLAYKSSLSVSDIPDLSGAYLSLSGGTMSNTNLVTNLNADLLDGLHESRFFRKKLIDTSADCDTMEDNSFTILDRDAGGLTCTNKPSDASIAGGYGVLTVKHGGYRNQLFFPYTGNGDMFTRSSEYDGGIVWRGWQKLYHSGNSNGTDKGQWAATSLALNGAISGATNIDSLIYFDTTNSRIGIGTTNPSYNLDVGAGNFRCGTGVIDLTTLSGVDTALTLSAQGSDGTTTRGKGVAIRLGHDRNGAYCSKIACVFEDQNPNYLQPALAFYTMYNSYAAGSEVERMRIASNGNVGIGTSSPSYPLDVAGVIHASTGIWTDGYFSGRGLAQTSDERDKGGWRNITFTLADIVNAPAGSFAWLNGPGRSAGTTAQYWQKFTPELVGTKPDGKLSLEYGPLAFLIAHKTAEELDKTNTKVDTQGEELRRVKEELNAAKGQIKELRARLGIAS